MSEIEKKDIDDAAAAENGLKEEGDDENVQIANGDEKTAQAKKNKKKKAKKASSEYSVM